MPQADVFPFGGARRSSTDRGAEITMARRISRDADDRAAGLTFHNSPSRMQFAGMSFVAMQRLFDQVDNSIFRCTECGWRGRGRDLAAMEHDSHDAYAFDTGRDSWYACPSCENEISLLSPIMRLVAAQSPPPESIEEPMDIAPTVSS